MFRKLLGTSIIILAGLSAAVPAEEIKIAVGGGFETVRAFRDRDIQYISLSELANSLGGTVAWETIGHSVAYTDAGFKFEFLIGAPWVNVNDVTHNLTHPVVYRDGQLYVPMTTFLPLLDRVTNQHFAWAPDEATVRVESGYFSVTDLSIESKANGLLIEIFLTQPLVYEIFITEGNWLNVSLREATVNSNRILSRRDARYLYDLKVHQIENRTGQISMRLKRDVTDWSHTLERNPTRIQILIRDTTFRIDTATEVLPVGPDDKIDVILVDAGHGGEDYGAIGQNGTREKDVVLSIAKKLAALIRKEKVFRVVMTRDGDRTVTLEERAKVANEAGADLFISIHANASPRRNIGGWNVFFLAPALNDSARSVAQLENSFFLRESYSAADTQSGEEQNPLSSILSDMLMTEFQAESHEFARMADRELRRRLDTEARGIDQAGFFVLNKVFTPSVLIESAFISNPREEKLLKDKKYQEKVAEGIYEAVKRFKAKYESDH